MLQLTLQFRMATDIKRSAVPAAGYVYQTLQGVSLLCDWLDSPSRYTRVRFECDEEAVAPQGLDDLVAERADGRLDLWQVKFTVGPDRYGLDWDWLLERSGKAGGKSRSNLRKWFDALCKLDQSKIGAICLVTNRVPDHAIESCLGGGKFIDYSLASATVRAQVEIDLGGPANAMRLFQTLEIKHSDKNFSNIEAHVTQRLRRHATTEGIGALKYRAINWSIEKDQPSLGGWITLALLKATLKVVAPEPLPENFVVPLAYRVPDEVFHAEFIDLIVSSPNRPIVLAGPPGRGKSTYLSKVCEQLQQSDIPFIRHHYYLSLTDRTHDRLTSYAVEESLLSQIQNFHRDVAVGDQVLATALEACASYYKKNGKPFVVVLDGLDHVWRSHGHDKRPLDDLFSQVLQRVENLVIVVGTQPVADEELPDRLLLESPRSTWKELPTMSSDAVLHYLRKEVRQGRLRLNATGAQAKVELLQASTELRNRTNGHPLHVIYATEELVRSNLPLSKWHVDQLAGDLSHDVKSYYGSLWQKISPSQKDVLRLVCEFSFFWPKQAFLEIASRAGLSPPSVSAVEHLLHNSTAGLKAFHESLIVFVRLTDGYETRISELTPHVEAWLSTTAPNSLRVNWLWSVKGKLGRPEDLISGLQRDWVMQRLQEGYPKELFEGLLSEAEQYAIDIKKYASAYRLRHLKSRLLNSYSYQLFGAEAARLKACTWTLAPDQSVVDEAVASRHETSNVDVAALSLAMQARSDSLTAEKCAAEAYRRHRGESRFFNQNNSSEAWDKTLYLVKAFSALGIVGKTSEGSAEIVGNKAPAIARKFLEAQVEKENVRSLVNIAVCVDGIDARVATCDAAVRTAAIACVDLTAWDEFSKLKSGFLIGCLAALAQKEAYIQNRPLELDWNNNGYQEQQDSLAKLAHDWFFGAIFSKLVARDCVSLMKTPKFKERENVSDYLDRLGEIAVDVASKWATGEPVKFSYIYTAFDTIQFPGYAQSFDEGQAAKFFRQTLHAIAFDLHLLSSRFGQKPIVDDCELLSVMDKAWFDVDHFRSQYVSGGAKVLSDAAATLFIDKQLGTLDADVKDETGVLMRTFLELCEMALRHNFSELGSHLCRRTWELVLGYGQRKDPALSDVMDALGYLTSVAPEDAKRLLAEISPQVHNVLAYTDGKGTRHILEEADQLLARLHRGALVEKYREHTEAGDWSAAEDSLKAFLTISNSESPIVNAILRTGLHAEAIASLRTAAAGGDMNATAMLALTESHVGADVGEIRDRIPSTTSTESKPFTGDVSTYQLTDLSRLVSDLAGYYGGNRHVIEEWYQYWEARGKGSELIATLEPILLSDACGDNGLNRLLDLAFETKLRLEGDKAAFRYIVQAQLFNGGWLGPAYLERRAKTEARLKRVVEKYPNRCDEFVQKSTFSLYSLPLRVRVIPGDIMVFFLGIQNRVAEASEFAEAMVRSVQDDTRTLALRMPAWGNAVSESLGSLA